MSRFARILLLLSFVFLCMCEVCEIFPLFADYASYENQAGLQRTRATVLAQDMLALEYLPLSTHAQALSSLEITLPLFIQEQTILQQDQAVDTKIFIVQSQADYLSIVAAVQATLKRPEDPVDPIQVDIVSTKSVSYRSSINQAVTVIVSHSETSNIILFFVKTFVLCWLGVVLWIQTLFHKTQIRILTQKNRKD